jgi:hypothetical protein
MLGDNLSARINALIADHHRMTACDLPAACDQLLDLMAVGAAEGTLCHVAPVRPFENLEAVCGVLANLGTCGFLLRSISGHTSHPI